MFVLSIPNYICIICATQGSIPAEIGDLFDLEWLDLSNNVIISGTIPYGGFPRSLKHLDLRNNNIGVWSLFVSQLIQCLFSLSYVCFFYFKISLHPICYPGQSMGFTLADRS